MEAADKRILATYEILHAMPEVGFNEFKTSAWLAEKIGAAGFTVTTGVGGTGIVAELKGKEPGPVVALRADMDALAHTVDGKDVCVHSCGHDSHCAMVLTAAEEISRDRHQARDSEDIFSACGGKAVRCNPDDRSRRAGRCGYPARHPPAAGSGG